MLKFGALQEIFCAGTHLPLGKDQNCSLHSIAYCINVKKNKLSIKKQESIKYTIVKALLTFTVIVMMGQAKADIATSTLNFFAPEQSFWGPGGSSANLNFNGSVGLPYLSSILI